MTVDIEGVGARSSIRLAGLLSCVAALAAGAGQAPAQTPPASTFGAYDFFASQIEELDPIVSSQQEAFNTEQRQQGEIAVLGDLLSDLCTDAAGGSPVRLPSRLASTLSSIGAPGFVSGEALTPSTCAAGIGSLQARSAAMETALGFESDLLKAMNNTLSQLSAAANAASATASPGVEVSVSAASAATPARIRAAARRHLTVRVRGRGGRQLRHIRIFLNGRKLAERHAARATARIHWHRVGPGAHHVHARVTDDRGERVIRHLWLVRRRQSS